MPSFVNNLLEVGLYGPKCVGGGSKIKKNLLMVPCAVSWMKYCILFNCWITLNRHVDSLYF
jgi:hypothetical protein